MTIFGKPRYKYLADIVRIDNVDAARGAIEELWREFDEAVTLEKKRRIWRAADLAAKRCFAMLKRRNLSRDERAELRTIGRMYRRAADEMLERIHKLERGR